MALLSLVLFVFVTIVFDGVVVCCYVWCCCGLVLWFGVVVWCCDLVVLWVGGVVFGGVVIHLAIVTS